MDQWFQTVLMDLLGLSLLEDQLVLPLHLILVFLEVQMVLEVHFHHDFQLLLVTQHFQGVLFPLEHQVLQAHLSIQQVLEIHLVQVIP